MFYETVSAYFSAHFSAQLSICHTNAVRSHWSYKLLQHRLCGFFMQIYLLCFFLPKTTSKDNNFFQPRSIKHKKITQKNKLNFDLY